MDGYVALARLNPPPSKSQGDEYEAFLSDMVRLLFSSLFFEANLPRRTTALQALECLHKIVIAGGAFKPHWMCATENGMENLLHILESDSYETNKDLALSIFDSFWPLASVDPRAIFGERDVLEEVLASCDSPNPIRSTTASYLLRLLMRTKGYKRTVLETLELLTDRLEAQIAVARRDLSEAARERPMFGLLFCIRAVLTDLGRSEDTRHYSREWVGRTVRACMVVSDIVSEVLNSDSPEGQTGSPSCDGQTLLMCCWRSSKEVSHLLAALIDKLPNGSLGDGAILSVADVKDIGNFFTRLLGTTVHRGAFEQESCWLKSSFCNVDQSKYPCRLSSDSQIFAPSCGGRPRESFEPTSRPCSSKL